MNEKKNGIDVLLRLALPIVGLLLIFLAMTLALFMPATVGDRLYMIGGVGVFLFLTIFLTWEKGNLLNFFHQGIYVALVAGCFVLVYMIVKQHPTTWDLTKEKIHSLSPQTVDYLKKVPQPLKIVGFVESDDMGEAEQFLSLYRNAAPARVTTEVHDIVRDKLITREYAENVYPGDFFVIREDGKDQTKNKKVSLGRDLQNAESQITNAVVEIMRDEAMKIYFLAGHGEKPLDKPDNAAPNAPDLSLSRLRGILQERAFPCETLNLLQRGLVPNDAIILVLPGPQQDIFDLERDMLDDYLSNGGKLFLLFDPILEKNIDFPNLRWILNKYGIETPPNSVIFDLQAAQTKVGPLVPFVQEFGPHKIMQAVPQKPFVLVEARPIEPARPAPAGVTVTELFKTGKDAWSMSVDDLLASGLNVKPPAGGTKAQCLAVAAEKMEPGGRGETRLVVVGDSDVFTDAAIDSMTATFFFQACNWLAEQEDLLSIPPKILSETPILLEGSDLLILSFSLGLIVLIVLFGGLGFTVLRRKLG